MKKKVLSLLVALMVLSSQAFATVQSVTLLNGVTTTGASSAIGSERFDNKTIYIVASSVTTGGTVLIQSSGDGTNWATIQTVSVTANGTTEVAITGMLHKYIRANLSARTDGTYTVLMVIEQ